MNEFRRNLTVGLFALGALGALGVMILLFGKAPQAFASVYQISVFFPSAGPVQNGDPIIVNGLQVGQVQWIEPMPDIRDGVKIVCQINQTINLPENTQPLIKQQSVGFGNPSIQVEVTRENSSAKMLAKDGSGKLYGTVAGGIAELVPKETLKTLEDAGKSLTSLASSLKPVAEDLHVLFKPTRVEDVDNVTTRPDRPLGNISTAVQRFDLALKSFNQIMADPNNQKNVEVTLRNFRMISERGLLVTDRLVGLVEELKKMAGNTDEKITHLASRLIEDAGKLSLLLDKLNSAGDKLANGQGSAGKFLNDPELYNALTTSAMRLQLAFEDLHTLLQQWREKGIKVEGGLLGK